MLSRHSRGAMRALTFASTFGLTMAAFALFGLWAGTFLDRKLGTTPWLSLALVLLAIYGGFRQSFRHLRRILKDDE